MFCKNRQREVDALQLWSNHVLALAEGREPKVISSCA
jgi:hypothetical protein